MQNIVVSLRIHQAVVKEVTDSDGHTILFIDEIHTVVGAGNYAGCSAVSLTIMFSALPLIYFSSNCFIW